ncbi:hypothetical protein [Paractinoplanes rishiriensis]|uniref:Uncharacterized protein n=1 Tax=Paractinoplanes rishiriensis TaxID=1050105 RepID=A0A919K5I1_9ACTN|nr:hypothetical protein [Actinoplanes rishiriensis]GIF01221.1 hypothetical protein Ari01nite_86850 [Actinoplanes rishiriensis]
MNDRTGGPGRPITKVRAGMRVLDVEGEIVGRVTHVATGDRPATHGWAVQAFGAEASAVTCGPAERLMSGGFLKVFGTGLHGVDSYVAADQISEVDDLTVLLRVGRDELIVQQ